MTQTDTQTETTPDTHPTRSALVARILVNQSDPDFTGPVTGHPDYSHALAIAARFVSLIPERAAQQLVSPGISPGGSIGPARDVNMIDPDPSNPHSLVLTWYDASGRLPYLSVRTQINNAVRYEFHGRNPRRSPARSIDLDRPEVETRERVGILFDAYYEYCELNR